PIPSSQCYPLSLDDALPIYWAQRHDLVFVGGFLHLPNLDAMQWFIGEVFPLIREQLPKVQFHCIGADVPDSIRALAENQPGVTVDRKSTRLNSSHVNISYAV